MKKFLKKRRGYNMDLSTKDGMIQYCNQVAKTNNWILNQDNETFMDLVEGLLENKLRFGYQSCPCRLATGNRDLDRDLICPCEYAPTDIKEFGACYCNLYMSQKFYEKGKKYVNVPERRPMELQQKAEEFK
jgi:ferredoxin-thioredoxin reductase catalytic chain